MRCENNGSLYEMIEEANKERRKKGEETIDIFLYGS